MACRWFMICFTLSLYTSLSISADVFISIDCGSSDPSKDENGIAWVGDDKYVKTGESRSVKPYSSISHVADTMRVFTTGKKNCYYIDSVKQGRVLVRASFYYGNYDGKSSPPTFALHFDGNHWVLVQTSNTVYYYNEVTYVMKKDSISVCVAQTEPEQYPFITALEVRSLESFMYCQVEDSVPVFVRRRVAFGSNTTIRFQDDPYDRLWAARALSKGSIRASSDALFGERPLLEDRPPPAVLKQAMVAASPNTSIELLMGFPDYEISVYINFYFSEITQLKPNQTRSFSVFKNNKPYSNAILPPYEDCNGKYVSGITVSSNTSFSLVPTENSTLPPLINAMEIFDIGEYELTDGTNKKDGKKFASNLLNISLVFILMTIYFSSLIQLKAWLLCKKVLAFYKVGVAILVFLHLIHGIGSIAATIPRHELLGGYDLSGLLPDFNSMNALQTIDLHNNSLRGPIPDFLGTLPKLKTLNIGNNQFNGTIPASLSMKDGLNLTWAGNPDLCTSNISCPIPATAPPPANSSIKKKKNYILELLFVAVIPTIIIIL